MARIQTTYIRHIKLYCSKLYLVVETECALLNAFMTPSPTIQSCRISMPVCNVLNLSSSTQCSHISQIYNNIQQTTSLPTAARYCYYILPHVPLSLFLARIAKRRQKTRYTQEAFILSAIQFVLALPRADLDLPDFSMVVTRLAIQEQHEVIIIA
jgi:hypothetical protein